MKKYLVIILLFAMSVSLFSANFQLKHIKSDSENYPLIISSVQVLDTFKKPVSGLKAGQFSVMLDAKNTDSLSVMTYEESGQPLYIMLCLDISGSMKGAPLQAMKSSIVQFIDEMRDIDKVAIVAFANDAELISDFSNDKSYLRDKVNELTSKGNQTALYYGAYKGLQKLSESSHRGGKIQIIIGDGKNENPASSYTEDDVITLANQSGIPVFSLGYSAVDKSFLQSFERMSDKTGGSFYHSPSLDELQKQYRLLYEQILKIYLLQYMVYGIQGDGLEHQAVISLNHQNSKQSVNAKVTLPAGVSAEKTPEIIDEKDNHLIYMISGIFALILILSVWYFVRKSKKQKAELESQQRQFDEEKKKAEKQFEDKLEKQKTEMSFNPVIQPGFTDKTSYTSPQEKQDRREKTMIMDYNPTQSQSSQSSGLQMEVVFGPNSGQTYQVSLSGATIGRKSDNTIVFSESAVSSYHAKIYATDNIFYIEDLNSTNGTYINGIKIQLQQLKNNDSFKIGAVEGKIKL
ncbi:MAG TPA: FHA domain-containing protein [Candidatus Cloacimonadota bacterium]|nr:FHA domain-containing protein [Candidatus Cloacimonadota bacterium]